MKFIQKHLQAERKENGKYYDVSVIESGKPLGKFIFDYSGKYFYQNDNIKADWADYILIELGSLLRDVNHLYKKTTT